MKYDDITKRLGNFLLGNKKTGWPALIDPYEHGRLIDGTPKPINIKWQLANKKLGRPKRFSRTPLQFHIDRYETYYYRSNRSSGYALLMIDIDAHGGEEDAETVAQYIQQTYFPSAYYEPSTGGKGSHLYAVIAFNQYCSRSKVNHFLKMAGISLRELVKDKGFKAVIDHKPLRTFSIFAEQNGTRVPVSMGQLAKLPRPQTLADMDQIESAPVYLPRTIDRIIGDYKALRAGKEQRPLIIDVEPIIDAPVPRIALEATRKAAGAFKGMKSDDPRSRSVHSVMALARQLGRLPSNQEAYQFYMASGLATIRPDGDSHKDVLRRMKRIVGAIKHVEKTFDVSKSGQGYSLETLLPMIREHVQPDHRKGTKYADEITDEDLAIALHVIELASFTRTEKRDYQWGCPNDSIQGMFRTLKEAGKTKRGCNRNKAVALKLILSRAKLAEVIDESYRVGSKGLQREKTNQESLSNNSSVSPDEKAVSDAWAEVGIEGRGKRIVIGYCHPRRAEWEIEYQLLAEWVLTGRKSEAPIQPVSMKVAI